MLFDRLFGFLSKDAAMDLGTANTLIYMPGEGIVLNEPSVVAINKDTGQVIAVGREAKEYLGRTPQKIRAVRPMKDGVIADFEVTQQMIKYFLRKVNISRFIRPKMVICVPTGITQVEKRAVVEAAEESGVRKVFLIEEPMAAAIGAGLEIEKPSGQMVIDIGGGTTEVAVISVSAIACSESHRVAGDEINESIVRYMQKKYQILIGENTSEHIKINIGSAYPLDEPQSMFVSGKEILTGFPKAIPVTDAEIREAIAEPVNGIIGAIRRTLDNTPPELVADIHQSGLHMAGGGSLLKGLDRRITEETRLKTIMTEDPLTTVVMGSGRALEEIKDYARVFIN